jgi:hypothetical protein
VAIGDCVCDGWGEKGRQNFFVGNFLETGLRPKKVVKFFGRPLSIFLNTPLVGIDLLFRVEN